MLRTPSLLFLFLSFHLLPFQRYIEGEGYSVGSGKAVWIGLNDIDKESTCNSGRADLKGFVYPVRQLGEWGLFFSFFPAVDRFRTSPKT